MLAYPTEQIALPDVKIDQPLRNTTINPIKLKAKHTPKFESIMIKAPIQRLKRQIGKLTL